MRQSMRQLSSLLLIFLVAFPIYTNSAKLTISQSSKSSILAQMSTQLSEMTDYAVDDALSLLELLASKTNDELIDLQNNFQIQQQNLQDTISSLNGMISAQNTQCDSLNLQQNILIKQINDLNNEIAADQAQIAANLQSITDAENQVCSSTLGYIADIKNQKDAISLFEALKQAVTDFQNNPSMVELHRFTQILLSIRSKAKGKAKQDQTDVHERTSEEIGTGHIDTTPEEIAVGTLDSNSLQDLTLVKSQLIDLINQLAQNTQNYINDQIQKQNDFNELMAEKIAQLKAENVQLARQIEKDQAQLVDLQQQLEDIQSQFGTCQSQSDSLSGQLSGQQASLEDLQNKYYSDSAQLQGQIDLFDQVIELYKEKVVNIAESLKQRSDDYINNQNFDNSQFSSQAAGEESELSGNVSGYVADQAAQA